MRTIARHGARIRTAMLLITLAGGLSCEPSRIAAPPADRVLWRVPGDGAPVVPSFDSTTAFFANFHHGLVAIDRRDGAVRWRASTGVGTNGPVAGFNSVVAGDVVVVGDVDLYAYNRESGALAWSFRASDDDETGDHFLSTDDTVVYASSLDGRVYAIDSRSGVPLWVTQLPGPPGVRTITFDPVVGHKQVFVGLWHDTNPITGGLAALDARTGQLLWTHPFTPWRPDLDTMCTSHAVIADGLVITAVGDGQIYGLDTATGDVRWVAPKILNYDTGDDRALALSNDVVLASSNSGFATGIDVASGAVLWSTQLSGSSLAYFGSADSQLAVFGTTEVIAVDPHRGTVDWRTGVGIEGGAFWSYALVTPDGVLANGLDGFYALKR